MGEVMATDDNVAIMQRAYDAFNAADIDTLTELFDENIVWHLPGRSSMAKDYEGRDATLAYFGQIGQETGGTFQAELQQLFAGDDGRVVGFQRSTGERNGSAWMSAIASSSSSRTERSSTAGSTSTTSTPGTSSGRKPFLRRQLQKTATLKAPGAPAPSGSNVLTLTVLSAPASTEARISPGSSFVRVATGAQESTLRLNVIV
jgi:ketosteroid isomerase-like protein